MELIGPEKTIALLLENYSKYFNDFTWWLSGERSLPFGLLVHDLMGNTTLSTNKWMKFSDNASNTNNNNWFCENSKRWNLANFHVSSETYKRMIAVADASCCAQPMPRLQKKVTFVKIHSLTKAEVVEPTIMKCEEFDELCYVLFCEHKNNMPFLISEYVFLTFLRDRFLVKLYFWGIYNYLCIQNKSTYCRSRAYAIARFLVSMFENDMLQGVNNLIWITKWLENWWKDELFL